MKLTGIVIQCNKRTVLLLDDNMRHQIVVYPDDPGLCAGDQVEVVGSFRERQFLKSDFTDGSSMIFEAD